MFRAVVLSFCKLEVSKVKTSIYVQSLALLYSNGSLSYLNFCFLGSYVLANFGVLSFTQIIRLSFVGSSHMVLVL